MYHLFISESTLIKSESKKNKKSYFILVVKSHAKYLQILEHTGNLRKMATDEFRNAFIAIFDGPLLTHTRKISEALNHNSRHESNSPRKHKSQKADFHSNESANDDRRPIITACSALTEMSYYSQ